MDYIKLPIKQYPNVEGAATDHELYWSKLKVSFKVEFVCLLMIT